MIYRQKIILSIFFLIIISHAQFTNPGCSSYSASNICIGCMDRYFLSFGLCMPVNPVCLTYDNRNGNCLSCYEGFILNGTSCSLIPIPNCLLSSLLNGCVQCEQGYTLQNKKCFKNVVNCQRYNFITSSCQKCKAGYQKSQQECIIAPIENCINQIGTECHACNINSILFGNICQVKDPQCLFYQNITCLACSQTFELLNNKCQTTIQYCQIYDLSRNCIQCQLDFKLSNNICIVNQDIEPFEQFCRQFNETGCVKCSLGYYLNNQSRCIQIDQYCKIFNYSINVCQQCYTGYIVQGNQCIVSLEILDPNCQIFVKNICNKCSKGYRFDQNGKCIELDKLCKTFDDQYRCIECYLGYMTNITDGLCIISSNKFCLSWGNGTCIKCTPDSYLQNGTCILIDQYCSKFNFTINRCISCYLGYILNQDQTQCNVLISLSTNYNCAMYNTNHVCVKCYFSYYLKNGDCLIVDSNCRTYNSSNGFCTGCYMGYYLIRTTGKCKRY